MLVTRTKLRASLVEQAAQLGPPWVLFVDKGKPFSIMPAGRPGDVAMVKGLPAREARKIIAAANSSIVAKREEAMSKLDFGYEMAVMAFKQAAQLVEAECCRVCRSSETQVLGHTDCWRLVRIAREIRKLGTKGEP